MKISWTEKQSKEVLEMADTESLPIETIRARQMRFIGLAYRKGGTEQLSMTGNIEGRRSRGRSE